MSAADDHNPDGEPPRKKQARSRSFRFDNISHLNPLGLTTARTAPDGETTTETTQPLSSDDEEEDSSSLECLRLIGHPAYLFEILQECQNESIIFIGRENDAFIALDRTVPAQSEYEHQILCAITHERYHQSRYRIQARSMMRAVDVLGFLLSLPSLGRPRIPSSIVIFPENRRPPANEEEFQVCSMAESELEKCLIGHKNHRKHVFIFRNKIFSVAQSRVLARKGQFVFLDLNNCRFMDHGEAFVRVHQEQPPQKEQASEEAETLSSPAPFELSLAGPSMVFSPKYWSEFLHAESAAARLQLTLDRVELSEAHCAAFSSTRLHCLNCGGIRLGDNGKALAESIRTRQGPKKLTMMFKSLRSMDGWTSFFEAIGSDGCRLRELSISFRGDRMSLEAQTTQPQWMEKLAKALHRNTSIEVFRCTNPFLDGFVNVYRAIQSHPTMTCAIFGSEQTYPRSMSQKQDHMKLIRDMVRCSKTLERVEFLEVLIRQEKYRRAHIKPHLTCNRFRNLLRRYHRSYLHRDATLAVALGKFSSKPSLLWMLVCDHHDAFGAASHRQQKPEPPSL